LSTPLARGGDLLHSYGMATPPRVSRTIIAAGVVSLLALLLVRIMAPERGLPQTPEMVVAAHLMSETITAVGEHREAMEATTGDSIDEGIDPNRTGLIGPQFSPLFTTVGHLEAKRTTTSSDMAALLVHLLREAGVETGDRIAIGASGSFPALLIASLAAAESMMLEPVIIFSLGASSYGATDIEFNMLDLYEFLRREIGFSVTEEAMSLGGGHDVASELEDETRRSLITQIERSGIHFIQEDDLRRNVAARMDVYGTPVAFINIGGSDANLGTSPMILDLEPGVNLNIDLPPEEQRGMVFEMAARGVPVIHLLNIRGLASRYGLPWDPVPLPAPGTTSLYDTQRSGSPGLWLIAAGYLVALAAVVLVSRKSPLRGPTGP
jgi:poly-gamma-glutamate system protein